MKKISYVIIVSMFIFVGCDSETNKTVHEKSFHNELVKFSKNPIQVLNTDSELTSNGSPTLDKVEFAKLIEYVNKLGKEYDLQKNITTLRSSSSEDESYESLAKMDYYETMAYIEKNSTAEFYNYMFNFVEKNISLDDNKIINATGMLPSEQLSLIILNNSFNESNSNDVKMRAVCDCYGDYDSAVGHCRKLLLGKSVLTIAVACVTGVGGAIFAAATAIDHDTCMNSAAKDLRNCLN